MLAVTDASFRTVQKALAGLRRINLDGLRWRVFDAKGQVGILSLVSAVRNSSEKNIVISCFVSMVGAWTVGIPNSCCATREG